ncbi:TMEM175 family protein [Taibaiella koreensis]|uniref:TMEM175 family protein n=1 Tax=Taibaiella koreensis TaxID=1268548 RepID=UPI000E59A860|nr:TMEM175 family protein [Taibaiella koreensis]
MIRYNDLAGKKIGRIEALSDGVFAIALTLLVLEIKVPERPVHSEAELFSLFLSLSPKFLSYFLSFMTMGIFWNGQAVQLSYMKTYDRNLTWNALFFLLLVSLLPFTTAFLGQYTQYRFALLLYWCNILLLGLVLYLHWQYASKKQFIALDAGAFPTIDKAVRSRIVIAQVLYLAGALLCFIHVYLSMAFIILVQLNYAFAIISGKGIQKKKD